MILPRADLKSLEALECFQIQRRGSCNPFPGTQPLRKQLSSGHTSWRMHGCCGFVRWIWKALEPLWAGSWQIILIKVQESSPDIQKQSRTGQSTSYLSPKVRLPLCIWLLGPLKISVSRLLQALWGPTGLCLDVSIFFTWLSICPVTQVMDSAILKATFRSFSFSMHRWQPIFQAWVIEPRASHRAPVTQTRLHSCSLLHAVLPREL